MIFIGMTDEIAGNDIPFILQSYLIKFEATDIVHNSACWIHNGSIIIKA